MIASVSRRSAVFQLAVGLALVAAAACRGDQPVSSAVPEPSFAKGGPSGSPTVNSTTPAKAPQNTTLSVTVAGSGFDQGSRAVWAIDGDTTFATTKVKTNSTTYVSPKQLIANISIAGDAAVDLYDVQVVTLAGRKGIGIELFAVTGLVDLGPARDSSESMAHDINSTGTAVGFTRDSVFFRGKEHATRWSPAGGSWTATDLTDQLGGSPRSVARGVNAAGDIVGDMAIPSGEIHAFHLTAAGVVTDLGVLPGQSYSNASDINTSGEVVGSSFNIINPLPAIYRPFYWSLATGMVALPTLGDDNTTTAEARAINDNGTIVGDSWDPVLAERRAVQWRKVDGVWTITALPSSAWAIARSINNHGDDVGNACVGPAPCQAHAVFGPAG